MSGKVVHEAKSVLVIGAGALVGSAVGGPLGAFVGGAATAIISRAVGLSKDTKVVRAFFKKSK